MGVRRGPIRGTVEKGELNPFFGEFGVVVYKPIELSHELRASRPRPRHGPKAKVYIWGDWGLGGLGAGGLGLT